MKHRPTKTTFTKKLVTVIVFASIAWITWSYILASLGRTLIAEQLSIQVVAVSVSTILGYLCKSFFETNAEEKIKLEKEMMEKAEVTKVPPPSVNNTVEDSIGDLVDDDSIGE